MEGNNIIRSVEEAFRLLNLGVSILYAGSDQ